MENKIRINVDIMLFIIFLMLKLDGIIDWKWFWVFSPFWIVWIIQFGLFILGAIQNMASKCKGKYVASGDPLVWDAKTGTLYGPYDMEENEND